MTGLLSADTLLSVLAGMSLFALRSALWDAQLVPRLRITLRFGALVLGLFYIIRPLAWIGQESFADRVILILAALVPLAILLIVEAAVGRHAARWLKRMVAAAVPLLILGALLTPRAYGTHYLTLLLGFQVLVLTWCSWMLWQQSAHMEPAERRSRRFFAALVVTSLPVVVAESAVLRGDTSLHASALAVLLGVWLLFHVPQWTVRGRVLVIWGISGIALALITAHVLVAPGGTVSLLAATVGVTATLVFASILSSLLGRRGGQFERRLTDLLGLGPQHFSLERTLEALTENRVSLVPSEMVQAADVPEVRATLRQRPVWYGPGETVTVDADTALADIARATGASHVLCIGQDPLRLATLQLGPSDGGRLTIPLITALCRRLESEAAP